MSLYENFELSNSSFDIDWNISCDVAKSVVTAAYRYTMMTECIVASLAIPPNVFLLLIIWRVSVFSLNLRLLLAHFSFILLWYSIGDIVRAGQVLTAPSCGYKMTVRNCKILDLACTGMALANIFYSFLGLCVYRLYTSLRYRTYETSGQNMPVIGLVLILLSWLTALAVNCSDVQYLPNDLYLPICASVFVPQQYSLSFYVYLAFEMVAVIIILFAHFYTKFIARNMAINRARFDLSARFQIDQNVRVNAVLIPSLILHIICHIPTFVLLTGLTGDWILTLEARPWFTRITYLLRLVYATAHPMLAFGLNFNLKSHLLKLKCAQWMCAGQEKGSAQNGNAGRASNQVHHFNVLDKIWEDKTEQMHKGKAGRKVGVADKAGKV